MATATKPRFSAIFVDDTRRGWWAIIDNLVFVEEYVKTGLEKSQAEFGVMMLNNEGIGEMDDLDELRNELDEALEPLTCIACEKHFMAAQLHNQRCPADMP